MQGIRIAGYKAKEQKKEAGREGNALDKHIVLFVSEKYYVPSYKLPRWIIGLC